MTDSHCHLASHRFAKTEVREVIMRAREAGVERMISLATSEEDIPENVALAENHPEVYACVGIHPCDVHEASDSFEDVVQPHLSNPRVVAVGETGLDLSLIHI